MRIAALAVLLALSCAAALSTAAPLAVGMRMPSITLADQHGVAGSVRPDTRCIVFSRDMDAAKIVKEALADDAAALIPGAAAVIVSDISGMPSLVTKLFALPALRKRPYSILLDRDGKATADIPAVSGKVTVLYLRGLTVERIEYVDSADTLRATLHQLAQPPAQERSNPSEPDGH
ncbi:MAG TPA: FAD/FMN-containing dehydrogenase [Candidatus Margulisiibacteriota bacterium]|nr:FAD/FMN-containing dehydrogenase [Candidatus Margulisiibacteriota bacterium]